MGRKRKLKSHSARSKNSLGDNVAQKREKILKLDAYLKDSLNEGNELSQLENIPSKVLASHSITQPNCLHTNVSSLFILFEVLSVSTMWFHYHNKKFATFRRQRGLCIIPNAFVLNSLFFRGTTV